MNCTPFVLSLERKKPMGGESHILCESMFASAKLPPRDAPRRREDAVVRNQGRSSDSSTQRNGNPLLRGIAAIRSHRAVLASAIESSGKRKSFAETAVR